MTSRFEVTEARFPKFPNIKGGGGGEGGLLTLFP